MSKKIIKTQVTTERFIKLLDFEEMPDVGYDLTFKDLITGVELKYFYFHRRRVALEVNKNYFIRSTCKNTITRTGLARTNSFTTLKRLAAPWGDYDAKEFSQKALEANQNYGIDL